MRLNCRGLVISLREGLRRRLPFPRPYGMGFVSSPLSSAAIFPDRQRRHCQPGLSSALASSIRRRHSDWRPRRDRPHKQPGAGMPLAAAGFCGSLRAPQLATARTWRSAREDIISCWKSQSYRAGRTPTSADDLWTSIRGPVTGGSGASSLPPPPSPRPLPRAAEAPRRDGGETITGITVAERGSGEAAAAEWRLPVSISGAKPESPALTGPFLSLVRECIGPLAKVE